MHCCSTERLVGSPSSFVRNILHLSFCLKSGILVTPELASHWKCGTRGESEREALVSVEVANCDLKKWEIHAEI